MIRNDFQDAVDVAERVRLLLVATPVRYAFDTFFIRESIGVCGYRDKDILETLLNLADKMMYQAKQSGLNRYLWYPEKDRANPERDTIGGAYSLLV